MRAWRRNPFSGRYLLTQCAQIAVPVLLGLSAAPAQARLESFVRDRVDVELERCLGRPVEFGAFDLESGGVRFSDLRLPRRAGEQHDPIRVPELRLAIDWSELLREHRVRVTSARLVRPRLRLSLDGETEPAGRDLLADLKRSGIGDVSASDVSLELSEAGRRRFVGSGIDARLRVERGVVQFDVTAAAAAVDQLDVTDLKAAGALSTTRVRLDRVTADSSYGAFTARGAIDTALERPELSLAGRLALRPGVLPGPALPALAVSAQRGAFDFDVRGPLSEPARLHGRGRLALDGVSVRGPALAKPLQLASFRGDVAFDERRLAFETLAARGRGFRADGRVAFEAGGRVEAKLDAGLDDLAEARRFLPDLELWRLLGPRLGPARARIELDAGAAGAVRAKGSFELERATLHVPGGKLPALPLSHVAGRLTAKHDGGGLRLDVTDLALRGPNGSARGAIAVDASGRHRVELQAEGLQPELLKELLPGRFVGGTLAGTLALVGDRSSAPVSITGRARIENSVWQPPPDAPLHETRFGIRRAAGDYSIHGDRFEISDFDVVTSRVRGRGNVTGKPNRVRVHATLATDDAGDLMDAWPNLRGIAQRGRGTASLTATWAEDGLHGTLIGRVDGGTWLLPSAAGAEHTSHPLTRSWFTYQFAPDYARLGELELRGPEVNLSLDATWDERDRMQGDGRVWLTRAYAAGLAGPWKLPLIVLGRFPLATRFTLRGTAEQVRMDAAIAHGARWRLLRLAVPKRLQAIARGETPLWRAESVRRRAGSES